MEFYADIQKRWLIAVSCGALSVIVMLVVTFAGGPGYSGGPALLMACFSAAGLLTGVLSVAAKEKRRSMAYVAIMLSALPWLTGIVLAVLRDSGP